MLNWDQGGRVDGVGFGYTAWRIRDLNEYYPVVKPYSHVYEGMADPTFERHLEMFLYVDCPSLESKEIPEEKPLVGAVVRNVVVDIYYRDL